MSTFVIILIAGAVLAIAELTRSAEGTSGAAKRSEAERKLNDGLCV